MKRDKWLRAEQEIDYRIRVEFKKHAQPYCPRCVNDTKSEKIIVNDDWFMYATKKIIFALKEILK